MAIVQGRVQPESSLRLVVEWSYNRRSREFECDPHIMEEVMGIKGFDELLDQMLVEHKEAFLQRLVEIDLLGGEGNFSCCVAKNVTDLLCLTMMFEKLDGCIVQGVVIPLVNLIDVKGSSIVLKQMCDLPNVGLLVTDQETEILGCNRAFEQQLGYTSSDLIGLRTDVFRTSYQNQAFYTHLRKQIIKDGYWSGNLFSRNASGSNQRHHLCIYRITLDSGRVLFIGFSRDISASLMWMKNGTENEQSLFSTLPTKEEFGLKLESLANESSHTDLNIIMALRPNFRQHGVLDQQAVFADFIKLSRYTSLAGQLTRNVFVVCLQTPHCQWLSALKLIEIAIKGFFTELKSELGSKMYSAVVEGQSGVSVLGYDTSHPKSALSLAVQSMVSSRVGETGYYNFYNSELYADLIKRQHLELFLKKQIDNELVDVYFQPIVETQSGKVVRFEALARFQHEKSSYSTQEMISVIEDLELIAALDDLVCKTALTLWSDLQCVYEQDIGLSINRSLSTKLDSLQVLQRVLDLIKTSGVNPALVTIELTETAYFEQDEQHTRALEQIRREGVKIAIDDFGTGYASFSYLKKGQFDLLKIDRKFVTGIHENTSNYHIVKTITELAHQLGVEVIAEGVESDLEHRALTEIGVDYLQGFLFSRAVPPAWLERREYHQSLIRRLAAEPNQELTLQSLDRREVIYVAPDEPIPSALELMNLSIEYPLAVVSERRCVGVITQEQVSLHMMSSLLRNSQSRPRGRVSQYLVNQVMNESFEQVNADLPVSAVRELINSGVTFPWVLCDSNEEYRGMLTQEDALKYLASC